MRDQTFFALSLRIVGAIMKDYFLVPGDKAAFVCMSNPLDHKFSDNVLELRRFLESLGIRVDEGYSLYEKWLSPEKKAADVNAYFRDPCVKAVFDLSGGDLANEVLPYLDYAAIAKSQARLWGYSDLSCVINAIFAKTSKSSVLYQLKFMLEANSFAPREEFIDSLTTKSDALAGFPYEFARGSEMSGTLVGGNIRCFLKLAGTPYFPSLTDKILLLEALNGSPYQIKSMLEHLKQMGAFDSIKGVVTGTFCMMEDQRMSPAVLDLLFGVLPNDVPIAITGRIGHRPDTMAAVIGQHASFRTDM